MTPRHQFSCCSTPYLWSVLLAVVLVFIIFVTSGRFDHKLMRLTPDEELINLTTIGPDVVIIPDWVPANQTSWYEITELQADSALAPNAELNLRSPNCSNGLLAVIYIPSTVDNFERRQTIRDTWARHVRPLASIRFVIGRQSAVFNASLKRRLLKESFLFDDLIQYSYQDTHLLLSIKTLAILHHSNEYCAHVPFTIKCEDDVYLNWDQVYPHLMSQFMQAYQPQLTNHTITHHSSVSVAQPVPQSVPQSVPQVNGSSSNVSTVNVYHNTILKFKGQNKLFCVVAKQTPVDRNELSARYVPQSVYPNQFYPDYCNGSTYILGNQTVQFILDTFPNVSPHLYLEDVLFTGLVRKQIQSTIGLVQMPYFTNFDLSLTNKCVLKRFLSHHRVDPPTMRRLWYQIQNAYLTCS